MKIVNVLSLERPVGEAVPGRSERAGIQGYRPHDGGDPVPRGDFQTTHGDGGHPDRAADPHGRQTVSGTRDQCLPKVAGGRGKQVGACKKCGC